MQMIKYKNEDIYLIKIENKHYLLELIDYILLINIFSYLWSSVNS
jgi:hypothetical protein